MIRIQILSRTGCGRSTLAAIIADWLAFAGFVVDVFDGDPDETGSTARLRGEERKKLYPMVRAVQARNEPIRIETRVVAREPQGHGVGVDALPLTAEQVANACKTPGQTIPARTEADVVALKASHEHFRTMVVRLQDQLAEAHQENRRLRRDNLMLREAADKNYWVWQGDGEDHLESLVCPILIRPEQLRDLLKPKVEELRDRDQITEKDVETMLAAAESMTASGHYNREPKPLPAAAPGEQTLLQKARVLLARRKSLLVYNADAFLPEADRAAIEAGYDLADALVAVMGGKG